MNDLDISNWKNLSHVWTSSLWLIPKRKSTSGHDNSLHGNFVPQIPEQFMLRYTKKGDVVADLFLGGGTTAIEAARMGRKVIGVDINKDAIVSVENRLLELGYPLCDFDFIEFDSTNPRLYTMIQNSLTHSDMVDAVILHPPYHDIIQFSEDPDDLSNATDTDNFVDKFYNVACNAFGILKPGGFACLVIGDKYADKQLVPLSFYCMQQMLEVGFRLKGIVVKDIQGNERGKGKSANLWRYRALKFGFFEFDHEYVMVFFRE